jgi:DNA-binding CsgD family transcriptional regulator
MYYPKIKCYKEIVSTAAELFGMTETEAEIELDRRLRFLGISKETVVVYVNWADYNTLTIKQLAKAMCRSVSTIKSHLRTIRQEWPELFISAAYRDAAMAAARCPSIVGGYVSKWIPLET